jgi:hypothetical protein
MSLRIFHIVFVIASILLSLFVAAWGFRLYADGGSRSGLILGCVFLLSGFALVVYGAKVFKKLKELS